LNHNYQIRFAADNGYGDGNITLDYQIADPANPTEAELKPIVHYLTDKGARNPTVTHISQR